MHKVIKIMIVLACHNDMVVTNQLEGSSNILW